MPTLSREEQALRRAVWRHYRLHGRHHLPWRLTDDPYRILVSEVMLQQTQVERVVPKYGDFLHAYPSVEALARAPLSDVLRLWQGLGYNRRAKAIHACARLVSEVYGGTMPCDASLLQKLPGIGPYTASALLVFAYEKPCALLETNVRTVLIHHVLQGKTAISDRELMAHAERVLCLKRPREWNWALMDYGAYLKSSGVRVNSRTVSYVRQEPFEGSMRQLRGAILRELVAHNVRTMVDVQKKLNADGDMLAFSIASLEREGLLVRQGKRLSLPVH